MADRTNPFLEIGYSEYTGFHLMPFSMKERAVRHELNRQRVIVSILLDLHLMALTGFVEESAALTLRGAVSQSLEGHEGDAAAHCVPRQLLVRTRTPQEILRGKMPERAWALDLLFAETDVLPANFNISDSRAERLGLNEAFLKSCRQVIEAGQHGGQMEAGSVSMIVRGAFDKYKIAAKTAFQAAVSRLNDKLSPAYLFPSERARWNEQLQITEQYAEALIESNIGPTVIELSRIEGLMRVYTLK